MAGYGAVGEMEELPEYSVIWKVGASHFVLTKPVRVSFASHSRPNCSSCGLICVSLFAVLVSIGSRFDNLCGRYRWWSVSP